MSEILNLNDTTPAAPTGFVNVKWQKGPQSGTDPATGVAIYPVSANVPVIPTVIGFVMGSGVPGSNVGPMLAAPHAGSVSRCVVVVKGSDASLALVFRIKKNGVDVFSADPTIAAGTGTGTVDTFTSLTSSPLAIAAADVFSIDITSGSSSWQFTAQLE